MAYELEQSIFPDFPRTEHLPAFGKYKPNASSDDKVADKSALDFLLDDPTYVEEKIDGANSGIMYCPSLVDQLGQPFMLRNRNHILRKGFTAKTKGKQQFVPFWNWYYEHVDRFSALNDSLGYEACVYGEWMEQTCTIVYDKQLLPDKFIAYDIWDHHNQWFIADARDHLTAAGFTVPPLLLREVKSLADLPPLLDGPAAWAAPADRQLDPAQTKREGVYVKVCHRNVIAMRYKMVRPDYVPGLSFDDNKIKPKKRK